MSTQTNPETPQQAPQQLSKDTASVLTVLVGQFQKYLDISQEQAITMAIWVMFAHAHDAFDISPILALISPTQSCGKTVAMDLLEAFTPNPVSQSCMTSAALLRMIDASLAEGKNPSMLLDEFDSFGKNNESLRNALNSGHRRSRSRQTIAFGRSVKTYSTYCPKAIAGIDSLPSTLMTRSVKVRIHRKSKEKSLTRLDQHLLESGEFEPVRQALAAWSSQATGLLKQMDPTIPPELPDRAGDNWRALLAIAELAGPEWHNRAVKAALKIEKEFEFDETPKVQLIQALQPVCADLPATMQKIPTVNLITGVNRLLKDGEIDCLDKPLTPQALGRTLKAFGVKPHKWRVDDEVDEVRAENPTPRGYFKHELEKLFKRYGASKPGANGSNAESTTTSVHAEVVPPTALPGRPALEQHPDAHMGGGGGVN